MTKKTSMIITAIIAVVMLVFCVFAFLPNFEFGAYGVYHSPASLIQKGSDIGEAVEVACTFDADFGTSKTVADSNLVSAIQTRFAQMYNYYGVPVSADNSGNMTIVVPKTSNDAKTPVTSMLSVVLADGCVEIMPYDSQSTSYDADKVILSNAESHFKSASVGSYINNSTAFRTISFDLTDEGKAQTYGLTTTSSTSSNILCAIDGVVSFSGYCDGSSVILYIQEAEGYDASALAHRVQSYINSGKLDASVTYEIPEDIEGSGTGVIVVGIIFAVVCVALCALAIWRYKALGIAPVLSLLFAIVAFTWFAGLAYFTVLNSVASVFLFVGLGLIAYLLYKPMEQIRTGVAENRSLDGAINLSFNNSWKLNLIVNGIALVVGVILWVIPTAFTAYAGNVLVYAAVLSLITTLGLNRGLVKLVAPLAE